MSFQYGQTLITLQPGPSTQYSPTQLPFVPQTQQPMQSQIQIQNNGMQNYYPMGMQIQPIGINEGIPVQQANQIVIVQVGGQMSKKDVLRMSIGSKKSTSFLYCFITMAVFCLIGLIIDIYWLLIIIDYEEKYYVNEEVFKKMKTYYVFSIICNLTNATGCASAVFGIYNFSPKLSLVSIFFMGFAGLFYLITFIILLTYFGEENTYGTPTSGKVLLLIYSVVTISVTIALIFWVIYMRKIIIDFLNCPHAGYQQQINAQ